MDIGLTGGIASGKSTVAEMIRRYDLPIIDADVMARKVVEPGEPALQDIFRLFGDDMKAEDGGLDRKKLGAVIFKDEEKRKVLNRILHPAIRKGMLDQAAALKEQGSAHIVFDIPLLFESQLTHMVDQTLLVYVDAKTQLSRLVERDGSSEEEAFDRIQSQMPIEEKKELADDVIDNTGTREETEEQLTNILKKWGII
ncbi:dephospho-CoA kinase [Pseudalkalibacillus hwajinpoensis]|uniref:dephospho-CoA kinase n=1 Tax=Guptibacillus hwajinpoensis TaxID=208199 RepID=UPI001CD80DCA|nr:dephospho-CoA kinase [Pseudalkalibacillus hwajinpoensis]MCA0992460.1 dephospho-CoA kinase [Pseudalkalibacillus hwajinpoensis]